MSASPASVGNRFGFIGTLLLNFIDPATVAWALTASWLGPSATHAHLSHTCDVQFGLLRGQACQAHWQIDWAHGTDISLNLAHLDKGVR